MLDNSNLGVIFLELKYQTHINYCTKSPEAAGDEAILRFMDG
jgi:hypothetical protein